VPGGESRKAKENNSESHTGLASVRFGAIKVKQKKYKERAKQKPCH